MLAGLHTPRVSYVVKLMLKVRKLIPRRGMDRYVLSMNMVFILRAWWTTGVTLATVFAAPFIRAMVMTPAWLATILLVVLECIWFLLLKLNYPSAVLACSVSLRNGSSMERRLVPAMMTLLFGPNVKCPVVLFLCLSDVPLNVAVNRPSFVAVLVAMMTLLLFLVEPVLISPVIPVCVLLNVTASCVVSLRVFWRILVPTAWQKLDLVLTMYRGPRDAVVELRHISGRLRTLRLRTGNRTWTVVKLATLTCPLNWSSLVGTCCSWLF